MEERGKIVQNLNIHFSLISLLSSKDKFYTNITLIETLWAILVLTVLHSRRFKKNLYDINPGVYLNSRVSQTNFV